MRIREEDNGWCGGDDIIWDGYFTINYSPFTHGEVPGEVNFGNGERLGYSYTWSAWGTRAPTPAPTPAPTTPSPTRSPATSSPTAAPIAGTGVECAADTGCSSGSCKRSFAGGNARRYCCAFNSSECAHCAPFTGACELCTAHFDVDAAGDCAPIAPSHSPTSLPTPTPSASPTTQPSLPPTLAPSSIPTFAPNTPTSVPSRAPSDSPTTEAEASGASSSADDESSASAAGIIVGVVIGVLAVIAVAVALHARSRTRPNPAPDGRSDPDRKVAFNPTYVAAGPANGAMAAVTNRPSGFGDAAGPAYEGLGGTRYGSLGSAPDGDHAYNVLDQAGAAKYCVPMEDALKDGDGGIANTFTYMSPSDVATAAPDYASASPTHSPAFANDLDTGC